MESRTTVLTTSKELARWKRRAGKYDSLSAMIRNLVNNALANKKGN